MTRARVIAIVIVLAPVSAIAEPDLSAHELPFVPRLAMRAPTPATSTSPSTSTSTSKGPRKAKKRAEPDEDIPTALLSDNVRGQLTLGFQVDGAEPSSRGLTVAGNPIGGSSDPDADAYQRRIDYARARAYGFGDAVLGVHDLGVRGISTYLASQFHLTPSSPTFAPVESAWDQLRDLQIQAAWGEADGVFERGALRGLVFRGGRQFVYGPMITHFDGLDASWSWRGVTAGAYFGTRVPDWYEDNARFPGVHAQRGLVTGGELGVDLRRLHLRVPLAIHVRAMAYDNHGHSDATVDWVPRKDVTASGSARLFDGALAREHVTLRLRVSDETRLVIDGDYRHRRDPLWDYAFLDVQEPDAARRYLDLGPRLPRAQLRVRAGTVFLSNIDVLLHGGLAVDARLERDEVSYLAAGWLEGGAAFEVRVRRQVVLGLSGLFRSYNHADQRAPIVDVEDVVQDLSLPPHYVGERNLTEGGVSVRFSGGARKFSAGGEIYARRTRYAVDYENDDATDALGHDDEAERVLGTKDLRGGGRFSAEAWVTPNIRLRAEYDLSSELYGAPEVLGLKTLRFLTEGTF